jgi:N-acetyl-gamma-glutamyl-phosphate reductase
MSANLSRVRVGILGASGYTGAELVRLLVRHPAVELSLLTAEQHAGKGMAEVFPHLATDELPRLVKVGEADWDKADFIFCALPHGTTQEIIAALPERLRIVDLSADFRLNDVNTYAEWYGHAHRAPALQSHAVYGLTEHAREQVRTARLVANPGCYPTASLLPLLPLVKQGLIDPDAIIIDAKSGVSGAGRAANQGTLFCEVSEGMHAYGVGRHRHMPELEQELALAVGRPVTVSFTPHLIPMNRGEFITIYVKMPAGINADDLRISLSAAYRDEPFAKVVGAGVVPHTRHVRGSNLCMMGVVADRPARSAILLSVLDNLVKGASGQAIQNMNLMLGLPETMGLEQAPLFP